MSFSTLTDKLNVKNNTRGSSVRCYDLIVDHDITFNSSNYLAVDLPVIYTGDSSSRTVRFYFQKTNKVITVSVPQIKYTIPAGPTAAGIFYADISALTDFLIGTGDPDGTSNQSCTAINDDLFTTGVIVANSVNQHIEIKQVTPSSSGTNFTGTATKEQGVFSIHVLTYFH